MNRRVLILVVVLGLAAVAGGGWWFTHPAAIRPTGTHVSARHPGVNRTLYLGGVLSVKRSVKIVNVVPRVDPDAGADVDILACKQGPGGGRIGTARGAAVPCEVVRSAAGAVLSEGDGGWYLIARVIPASEERTVIRGVDVTYRDGLRRGHQQVDSRMVVRAARDQ